MAKGGNDGAKRPGPIYDDAMRILADDDVDALLSVLGVGGPATRAQNDLPATTIHPDLVVHTQGRLVHVEFVKDDSPDLDLRMVDYRVRLLRRDRSATVDQYVLALRSLSLPADYRDPAGRLVSSWRVVRVPELDPEQLLATPTTATLAPLAVSDPVKRRQLLVRAADAITAGRVSERRATLLGAAVTLASIVLPRPIIKAALEEAAMPVPVRDTPLGRELYDEGRQEGRQEGRRTAAVEMTAALLEERFGADERIPLVAQRLADLDDRARVRRIAAAATIEELAAL